MIPVFGLVKLGSFLKMAITYGPVCLEGAKMVQEGVKNLKENGVVHSVKESVKDLVGEPKENTFLNTHKGKWDKIMDKIDPDKFDKLETFVNKNMDKVEKLFKSRKIS